MKNDIIFRQFFEPVSSTYSYLIGSKSEAIIIDPVIEDTYKYIQAVRELDLKLVMALDTHVHADHITALGTLREETACLSVMGERTKAECVSLKIKEGEKIKFGGLALETLYTPGHTDDSYSFLMNDRVFTGDTLLIRGTGRTDFQNGDAASQYESIFNKLLKLPESTFVYPAHDYKGWTVTTIGEEKRFNPRLQVKNKEEYIAIMKALKLPNPKQMDIAVPANLKCGLSESRQS